MFHVTQRARHEVGSRYPLSRAEQRSQLRAWLYNSAPNTQQLARVLDRPEIHPAQPHASRHSA
jgi:hypothetical protein